MKHHVLEYLEASARRVPDKAAFIDEWNEISFQKLLDSARSVGMKLAELTKPRMPVAVLMDSRSLQTVTALLGALYSGCCYAPLDVTLPEERLKVILAQLRPAVIVYDDKGVNAARAFEGAFHTLHYDEAIRAQVNEDQLKAIREQTDPEDPLSILYTSGSTGIPKGVVQSQGSYIAYTEATIEAFGFTEDTVFGNQSPFFYANSIIDIYPPLALGATVYILPAKAMTFPRYLIEQLHSAKVTELTMTPSSYVKAAGAGVLEEGALPHLQHIILSGEAASWATLKQWMLAAPNAGVWNFYGSTEMFSVAVWRLDRTFTEGEIIPVGKPYPGVDILFAGDDGQLQKPGERGEMLIHNPWQFSGYYADEQRTSEAFVMRRNDAGENKTYYRTGDIGVLNGEGQLMVMGRMDQQIKHMGYRMELGEVEYALRALPGWIDGCCVFNQSDGKIRCFWVGGLTQEEIIQGLKKTLPRYALPDEYIHLETMPYTATMKIDRKQLNARK